MVTRRIRKVFRSKPTIEGAGVHLKRAFGFSQVPLFDPFLLLDDFRSREPEHYLPGFPWHPHRGIETITYVLGGDVEHGDSLGNRGVITAGDVQWMTAGSGIIHQEMPKGDPGGAMLGFQLWANLPEAHKMMEPRYRDVKSAQIPTAVLPGGAQVKVICGEAGDVRGPVRDVVIDPSYLDVRIPAGVPGPTPSRRETRPSPMSSKDAAASARRGNPSPTRPRGPTTSTWSAIPCSPTAPWSSSATAIGSRFPPKKTRCASCSSRESPWANPWPGTAPS